MKRHTTLFPLVVLLFALGACAGSSTGGETLDSGGPTPDTISPQGDSTLPQPDSQVSKNYRLTIVGWQSITLQQTQQVALQVRLTKNEESAANEAAASTPWPMRSSRWQPHLAAWLRGSCSVSAPPRQPWRKTGNNRSMAPAAWCPSQTEVSARR